MNTKNNDLSAHLQECAQCLNRPFDLCEKGERLLREAVEDQSQPDIELEEIVEELAAITLPVDERGACFFCRAVNALSAKAHYADCTYRRACEWLEENEDDDEDTPEAPAKRKKKVGRVLLKFDVGFEDCDVEVMALVGVMVNHFRDAFVRAAADSGVELQVTKQMTEKSQGEPVSSTRYEEVTNEEKLAARVRELYEENRFLKMQIPEPS